MSDLGSLLCQGREAKGLTLAQVEDATHIRRAYLQALEEGTRSELPDLIYSRGLAISYARYLALDEKEVKRLFEREYGSAPARRRGPKPLSVPLRLRRYRWSVAIVLALVLPALGVLAWWQWPGLESWGRRTVGVVANRLAGGPTLTTTMGSVTSGQPAVSSSSTSQPGETAPTPTSAALPLPTPAPQATATPTVASTSIPTSATGLRATVDISSPAWLRVIADGDVVYEGTLDAGAHCEWMAWDTLLIRTGNAGGTLLTLNGRELGPLGDSGSVVERRWLWQDGQAVEATLED